MRDLKEKTGSQCRKPDMQDISEKRYTKHKFLAECTVLSLHYLIASSNSFKYQEFNITLKEKSTYHIP